MEVTPGVLAMEQQLIKEDNATTVKRSIQQLVSRYGIGMVLEALMDESARLCLEDPNPNAERIRGVLMACKDEIDFRESLKVEAI